MYIYTTGKNMGNLESILITLVFDILIYWKWIDTNHEQIICDLNATLTCNGIDENAICIVQN